MIASSKIDFREDYRSMQFIEPFIDSGDRETIFYSDDIECQVIDAKASRVILFLDEENQ